MTSPPLRRFGRHPVAVAAVAFLVLLYLTVLVVPAVVHADPTLPDPLHSLAGPSRAHPLGTDELGRDELARLLAGGRITLTVAWVSITIALVFGTLVGALAGYYRGWVEAVLMRFVDAVMSIPAFFLILAELALFGHSPAVVVVVIGLNFWTPVARMVYAEFLRWRSR
ncbi:MAG: ABC transporter permease, partial [Clostridia bacterium]|nr:ABC transporter permease [Clostridia bacterium]